MIKSTSILLLPITIMLLTVSVSAGIEQRGFDDPEHQRIYYAVLKELRCLVCQNQTLAESDADLAKDLRNKTYELVTAGSNQQDIVAFMVQRYGDFVLYRPPFKATTWALWLGPAVLALIGLAVFWRIASRRRAVAGNLSAPDLDDNPTADADKLVQAKQWLDTDRADPPQRNASR